MSGIETLQHAAGRIRGLPVPNMSGGKVQTFFDLTLDLTLWFPITNARNPRIQDARMSAVCLPVGKRSRGFEADLVAGELRVKVLLHPLQTGSEFSQRWVWGYETKVQDVTRGGACQFQRQKSCRRAKVAADGSLRRVHRCIWSPWSCTETTSNCFDSVDATLGKVSKVFADYLATNLVEILAFLDCRTHKLCGSRRPEVEHGVPGNDAPKRAAVSFQ